ncbi:TetR family transcriptional regulator [Kaistia nematophila]|uniref:TetR family transcriptional regulator n=1 Tax=Kaistia nematophila TaxID=2994654 RepID=UPI0030B9CC69
MRRTKSQSEETRQRILDAAETVFIEIGVAGASLERIAAEAGVTRGAIYWHFANKQELLTAIFARAYDQHVNGLARTFEDASDPLRAVLDWALSVIELFGTDEHTRTVYRITVTRCEYLSEMQEAYTLQRSMHDTMVENFRLAFERASEAGQLAPGWTATTASTTLHCFMSGLLDNWLRFDFDVEVAKTLRMALESLVESFRRDAACPQRVALSQAGG